MSSQSSQSRPLDFLGIATMLVLCVSWGAQQPAAKLALLDIGPATQGALRSLGAGLIVAAWMRWRGTSFSLRDGTLWPGIAAGLGFSFQFLFLYLALARTDAARVIVFMQSAPFLVAIATPYVLRGERLGWRAWIGIVIAFSGVLLALEPWNPRHGASLTGDILGLLGGLAWGGSTVLIKATSLRSAPPTKVLLYQLVISTVFLGMAGLLMREHTNWPWTVPTWSAFLYQMLWIVAVTMGIWYWLIARYPAAQISAFTFLTPVFGLTASYLMLGEALPPAFLGACALVVGGLVLVSWPARKPPIVV